MTKKELEKQLEYYSDKARYFRRLAFVYRYGREEDIYSLINEIDEFEPKRELGGEKIYERLNGIVAKYFFPLNEQLKYLSNPSVVGFELLKKKRK